jgi:hypothetical protein
VAFASGGVVAEPLCGRLGVGFVGVSPRRRQRTNQSATNQQNKIRVENAFTMEAPLAWRRRGRSPKRGDS